MAARCSSSAVKEDFAVSESGSSTSEARLVNFEVNLVSHPIGVVTGMGGRSSSGDAEERGGGEEREG